MASPELHKWVDMVMQSTRSRAILWRQLTPTSYSWEQTHPKNARVTLQRVERMENYEASQGIIGQRKITSYILQVFELGRQQTPVVTVNGISEPDSNGHLEMLYKTVEQVSEQNNLDFLKSLLPGGSEPAGSSH